MSIGPSRLVFLLRRVGNQLWLRTALYGLAGIATALVAAFVGDHVSLGKADWLGANAVKDLLTILASSMLAVATFSLSAMVSAFAAASSSATPRASALLVEDKTAQSALATFIGAFVFSIVGLIALSTGIYGPEGRVVMFGFTVVVLFLVVLTLMLWVGQLVRFGRVGETILRVEKATAAALSQCEAFLDGRSPAAPPASMADTQAVKSTVIGYVQHVDLGRLQKLAAAADVHIDIAVLPGSFIDLERPLAQVRGAPGADQQQQLLKAFTIDQTRTYSQDPRFGLIVLAEIASRALSPAVNDPGTAIQVLHTQLRLLQQWVALRQRCSEQPVVRRDTRVRWPQIAVEDFFVDAFRPIARDGAGMVEVGQHVIRVLGLLARTNDAAVSSCARVHGELALRRFEQGLGF